MLKSARVRECVSETAEPYVEDYQVKDFDIIIYNLATT